MKLKEAKGRVYVAAYNASSRSAIAVANYLSTVLGRTVGVRARDARTEHDSVMIRWGNSQVPVRPGSFVLNEHSVACVNKHSALTMLSREGVPCPEYTNSSEVAGMWLGAGHAVVARHKLTGHSGEGIQVITNEGAVFDNATGTPWYAARLFTKYFKRKQEYRVFVVGQSAVFARRKGLASDADESTRQFFVRTHAEGWNFCAVELSDVPAVVLSAAQEAVAALGCQFGAVDVGWNEHNNSACVFEVNSAPGLEGSSVKEFCDALLELDVQQAASAPVLQRVTLDESVVRMQLADSFRRFREDAVAISVERAVSVFSGESASE